MEISEAKTPEPIPTRPSTVHRAVGVSVSVALLLGGHLLAFKASYSEAPLDLNLHSNETESTSLAPNANASGRCKLLPGVPDVTLLMAPSLNTTESRHIYDIFLKNTKQRISASVNDVLDVDTVHQGRFLYPDSSRQSQGVFATVISWHGQADRLLNDFWYLPPRGANDLQSCHLELREPVLLFRGWTFPSFQYGHLLHDLLPMLVWMASRYPKTKLIVVLDEEEKIRRFLQWFNMDLFHRAIFIPEETTVCAETIHAVVPKMASCNHPISLRILQPNKHLRQQIAKFLPTYPANRVVYQTRLGTAHHGRLVSESHSKEIVNVTKEVLQRHGFPEEIMIFTGKFNGETASFQDQYRIFNSAFLVLGPHGTGLSNILWMRCDIPVAVIEFFCGLTN
ncbi:unnamed protein product [Durusdinium trenchii]|uniref:Glycosyltransferase 61 catalytic domain-containing protein n=1 Tax=Durusdinium trenchii TaxID=1381693 RepID=A0ABP0M1L4_9DINO